MSKRQETEKESSITCACPKCGRVLQWQAGLSNLTVCPDCLSHYEIKSGTGIFVSDPTIIDPKNKMPFEGQSEKPQCL